MKWLKDWLGKRFSRQHVGELKPAGDLTALLKRSDSSESLRRDGHGRTLATDTDSAGNSTYNATGIPEQNEAGAAAAADRLAKHLTKIEGLRWYVTAIPEGETWIDAALASETGDSRKVQVTRPSPSGYYKALGSREATRGETSAEDAADEIFSAVQKKAHIASGTVLLIDAGGTALHANEHVATAYLQKYGRDSRTTAFQEIWIAGPAEDMVFKLSM